MLVLKHISSYFSSSGSFIFQLLAVLELKPLLRLCSIAAQHWSNHECISVSRLTPTSFKKGWAPSPVWKTVFLPTFKVFTALSSLRKIHLLFFFLQAKFFPIFLSLAKKKRWTWLKTHQPMPPCSRCIPRCSFSHHRDNSRLQHNKVHRMIWEVPEFGRCVCNLHFHSAEATRPRGGYGPTLVHGYLESYWGLTASRTQACSRKAKTKHLRGELAPIMGVIWGLWGKLCTVTIFKTWLSLCSQWFVTPDVVFATSCQKCPRSTIHCDSNSSLLQAE